MSEQPSKHGSLLGGIVPSGCGAYLIYSSRTNTGIEVFTVTLDDKVILNTCDVNDAICECISSFDQYTARYAREYLTKLLQGGENDV